MASILWVLFALTLRARALEQSNYNLTVSFSPSDSESCGANGSTEAITFTTDSIPPYYQCLNIDELFNSTSTSESGSETTHSAGSSTQIELISWRLYNKKAYDPRTNYSQVWYHQQNLTDPAQGQDAARIFEVFNGRNCVQTGPTNDSLYPVFGWTCQSSEAGDCTRIPYSAASIQIGAAWEVNDANDKCWTAYTGMSAGVRHQSSASLLIGLLMVTLLVSCS